MTELDGDALTRAIRLIEALLAALPPDNPYNARTGMGDRVQVQVVRG